MSDAAMAVGDLESAPCRPQGSAYAPLVPDPSPLPARLRPRLAVGLAIAFGLLLALWAGARLAIEWLWFSQFDFQPILLRRWMLQISAFAVVFGLGSVLQLAQLQRCWRLREQGPEAPRPSEPLLRLGNGALVLVLIGLVLLLAGGLSYLMVQARGLIANPFNGDVITGFSVLRDLPPLLVAGLALWVPSATDNPQLKHRLQRNCRTVPDAAA